jgi:hypothetical protein
VKRSSILIMALALSPLAAQEGPRLDGRIQVFAELSRPAEIVLAPGLNDQAKRQTGIGVRFMGELASHQGWYYELGGMFDTSSKFTINDGSLVDLTGVKVSESYWALGGAYMGKVGDSLTWGAHLEGRGEYLNISGPAVVGGTTYPLYQSTTYLRPWVRGSFDYTFAGIGAKMHPYIGVEGNYAITRTTQTELPTNNLPTVDNRTLKSMAPRATAALYAGIRF